MKKQSTKRALSLLLIVVMMLAIVPEFTLPARAASTATTIDVMDTNPSPASGDNWTYADYVYTVTGAVVPSV